MKLRATLVILVVHIVAHADSNINASINEQRTKSILSGIYEFYNYWRDLEITNSVRQKRNPNFKPTPAQSDCAVL